LLDRHTQDSSFAKGFKPLDCFAPAIGAVPSNRHQSRNRTSVLRNNELLTACNTIEERR